MRKTTKSSSSFPKATRPFKPPWRCRRNVTKGRSTMMQRRAMRFLLVVSLLLLPTVLRAQDAKLVDAAKGEGGKVVVYGSLENETMDLVGAGFKKKTGLDVEFWRGSSTKVMDRALSESRTGRPQFDVVLTNDAPMQFLQKAGVFAKYDSPSAKAFPSDVVDKELGPRYRNVLIGIVYNTAVIKPGDAPIRLQALLKPQYRGTVLI